MFHAVQIPAIAEGIENGLKLIALVGPVEIPILPKISLTGNTTPNDAAPILELVTSKFCLMVRQMAIRASSFINARSASSYFSRRLSMSS